jgi:hypothetical protein
VRIDIPRLLLHLRWKSTESQTGLKWPRAAEQVRRAARRFAKLARHPRTIRAAGKVGGWILGPFARDGWLKWMPPPFNAWTKLRDFPRPHPHRRIESSDTDTRST